MGKAAEKQANNKITNLPVELLDAFTAYLPTASSVASLGQTCKSLHTYVERDGWKSFSRHKFPSQYPSHAIPYGPVVRSLTSLSRSWDRLAFVARKVDVTGEIHAFPGNKRIPEWTEPEGQTIGFAPKLDSFEEIGSSWYDRREVLAFNAGAELCVRETAPGQRPVWKTYRPPSAREGRDDITTLHLLRHSATQSDPRQSVIAGTANGDLRIISFPNPTSGTSDIVTSTKFATNSSSVDAASLYQQPDGQALLAASLAYTQLALYPVDAEAGTQIEPLSKIAIPDPTNVNRTAPRSHRMWSTSFLSATSLAIGTGNCTQPIQIFALTPSGLESTPLRTYALHHAHAQAPSAAGGPLMSTVHTLAPLADPASSSSPGQQLFLSGASDGVVRLHDPRAPLDSVQHIYSEPGDHSAVYCLLPRGHKLFVGMSRESRVKVYDLRMAAKRYDYLDAAAAAAASFRRRPRAPTLKWREINESSPSLSFRPKHSNGTLGPDSNNNNNHINNFNLNHTATTNNSSSSSSSSNSSSEGDGATIFVRRTVTGGEKRAQPSSRGGWRRRRPPAYEGNSSVYSLGAPSPHSPYVYVGLEGSVVAFAFTGVLDRHPDPALFGQQQQQQQHGGEASGRKVGRGGKDDDEEEEDEWYGSPWPAENVMNVAMYEHSRPLQLHRQRGVEETWREMPRTVDGIDERWRIPGTH